MQNKEQNAKRNQAKPSIFNFMSLTERLLVVILGLVFAFTGILLLARLNQPYTTNVASRGGTFSETIVGYPQLINPILASSDTDQDLVKLIFSGLMRRDLDGNYVPDLADKYDISEDGKTYTFHINPQAKFHDGKPVTADDVIFTIEKAQNPLIDSPRLVNWNDVKITKKDEQTVVFSLKKPYTPFLTQLTLGILPRHLWQNIDNEQFRQQALNHRPIGSGPFSFVSHSANNQEQLSHFILKSFPEYLHGQPYISELSLNFTPGLNSNELGRLTGQAYAGISSQNLSQLKPGQKTIETEMERVFAVFFNPGEKSVLKDKEVRQALALLIDRDAIVSQVLSGHGRQITKAFPIIDPDESKDSSEDKADTESSDDTKNDEDKDTDSDEETPETDATILAKKIKALLEEADWDFDEDSNTWKNGKKTLKITLKVPQIAELEATAKLIEASWNEVGIKTEVETYPVNDFNKDIINTRNYEAILFGQIVDSHTDLTPLWHSSGRNAPGLNISGYTNSVADKLLEKMDQETNMKKLAEEQIEFNKIIAEDVPAIFLYSPNFIYLVPDDVKDIELGKIRLRNDRFNSIQNWYTKNDRVWNFLLKNK